MSKAKNYAPHRAEKGVHRVKHIHVLTLPKNGRKGCALCPYVEPREKLVMPEHMKADHNAKGIPHPNNHSTSTSTTKDTVITEAKVEPSTTVTPDSGSTEATGSVPLTTEQLQAMNTPALYRLATTKKVRGRSTMTKAQLIEALS